MQLLASLVNWIKGNSIVGIHINMKSNEEWELEAVSLQRKGENISLISKFDKPNSTSEFLDSLPAHSSISLCLTGTGLLIKEVDALQLKNGIETVLPNLRLGDFLIQEMEQGDSKALVAILRKDLLQKIIRTFQARKLHVSDIYLGPIAFKNITALFTEDKLVSCGGMELSFNNQKLIRYSKADSEAMDRFSLAGEILDSQQVLPFVSGLSTLAVNTATHLPDEIILIRKESLARRIIQKSAYASLGVLFFVLLLNFVQFNKYNKRQNQLNAQLSTGKNLLLKRDQLNEEVKQKTDFFVKSGLNTESRLSFYSDRIAACLSSNLQLTSIELNPVTGKKKDGKEIHFSSGMIRIEGETFFPVAFDAWVQKLKKESWLDSILKQEYFMKEKDKTGFFRVELKLK